MINFVLVYILGSLSIVYKGKSRVQTGVKLSTAIPCYRYYCRLYIPTKHYHLPGIFIRTCVYNHFLAFFLCSHFKQESGVWSAFIFRQSRSLRCQRDFTLLHYMHFLGCQLKCLCIIFLVCEPIHFFIEYVGRRRLEAIYTFG